jgi:hypothetical protein
LAAATGSAGNNAQPLQLDAELAAALGATSTSKGDTVLDHVLFLYPHSDAIHIFNAATKRRVADNAALYTQTTEYVMSGRFPSFFFLFPPNFYVLF